MSSQANNSTAQPRELLMLFFAEMWERFSFYGMRALLTLYLTIELFKDLADPEKQAKAFGIYAAYGALVYATPFVGGIIADRLLGFKRSVMFGAVMMSIGHFVMAIENEFWLYIALSFLIIGNGFFKPNISSMVGGLYEENDPRRDGGFTIFYMGINLGAFLAPLACGYIGETYGWFWGFGLAGIGMILGLIVFGMGQAKLGDNGEPKDVAILNKKLAGISQEHWIYLLSFVAVALFALLVRYYTITSLLLKPIALGILLTIFIIALRSEKKEREKLFVVLILLFFTTLFWAFFEQAGSSINLFTNWNVNRKILGFHIPASAFQAINPFFIIALGTPFSMMWVYLAKIKKEPSTPVKFTLGLFQLGLGFLIFGLGSQFVNVNEISIRNGEDIVMQTAATIPLIFLVLGYLLHTTGELCLSPVGLSMVTKLAPKRIMAMVMGAWFLSSALAHDIGGTIAVLTAKDSQYKITEEVLQKIEQETKDKEIVTLLEPFKDKLYPSNKDLNNAWREQLSKEEFEKIKAQRDVIMEFSDVRPIGDLAIEAGVLEKGQISKLPKDVLISYDRLAGYISIFTILGWIAIGASLFLLLLVPLLRRWMHEAA